MTIQHRLLCLTLLVSMTTGCSKFRQMTRRDYSLLRDPFASNLAADESAPPTGAEETTSGYVKIDDDAAGKSRESVKADYGNIAQASATENEVDGAGRGTFPGIRVRGMGDVVSSETADSPPDSVNTASAFAEAIDELSANGEARVAQAKSELKKQADEIQTARTEAVADPGFAEWASSKKERWKQEVASVKQQADTAQNQITQVSKTVDHGRANPMDFASDVASPLIRRSGEIAKPLIATQPPTSAGPDRNLLKLKPIAAPTAEMPPPDFGDANPFAEPQSSGAVQTPAFDDFEPSDAAPQHTNAPNPFTEFAASEHSAEGKPSESKALDAGFSFDTGWRPAEAQSP